MNKYISIEARHVAALILIKARSGIRPPVMRNVKVISYVFRHYCPSACWISNTVHSWLIFHRWFIRYTY